MSTAPKSHNATMPAKPMTMIKTMRKFGIGALYPMKTYLTLIVVKDAQARSPAATPRANARHCKPDRRAAVEQRAVRKPPLSAAVVTA